MQRIQLKAGLLTVAVLAVFALVMMVMAGILVAVIWALMHLLGLGLQQSMTAFVVAVLVSPFVVFIGWAAFDLVSDLYSEMLGFLDAKRRMR